MVETSGHKKPRRSPRISNGAPAVPAPGSAAESPNMSPTTSGGEQQATEGGLTEYERERLALIERNKQRMAALQLPQLAADLAATMAPKTTKAAPTQKGIGLKRSASQLNLPPRHSLRTRGIAPEAGEIVHEGRDGKIVVKAAPTLVGDGSGKTKAPEPEPKPRFTLDPHPFTSTEEDAATDAAFLGYLRRTTAASSSGKASDSKGSSGKGGASSSLRGLFMKLRLDGEDVAKMTKQGTTCVAWHPCSGTTPLIAASDKSGQVAVWSVDYLRQQDVRAGGGDQAAAAPGGGMSSSSEGGGEGGSAFEGIMGFQPHTQYVSAMRWLGTGVDAKLLTSSYDGSARMLDLQKGQFLLVPGLPPPSADQGWSAADADSSSANTIYLASSLGDLTIVDVRAGAAVVKDLHLHDKKVNTLDIKHGAGVPIMASSCSGGTVKVWDVRRLLGGESGKKAAPLSTLQHSKSSQGAVWAPDGSGRLLSISFDDTLRVWGPRSGGKGGREQEVGKAMEQQLSVEHNNNTGRWVIPFRPAWWGADCIITGDMKRGVAAFDAANGQVVGLLAADGLTAIPSRLAVWNGEGGGKPMLAAATSSGRVHIFR